MTKVVRTMKIVTMKIVTTNTSKAVVAAMNAKTTMNREIATRIEQSVHG